MGWNLNSTKYIFPFWSKMIALHQNEANCQNTLTALTQRWRIFPQDVWMCQMCMTDAGTTQDNFILPAPLVGGLPISQDWLDRMKLVHDRTLFQSSCHVEKIYWLIKCLQSVWGTPTLARGKSKADLAAKSAFWLPLMPVWLGTQPKTMYFWAIFKKTHFRITISMRGCSSFIWCKAWRHESESVKAMYLDAIESLIYNFKSYQQ